MLWVSCKYIIAEASCCAAVTMALRFGGPGYLPDGTVLNTPLSMAACSSSETILVVKECIDKIDTNDPFASLADGCQRHDSGPSLLFVDSGFASYKSRKTLG